MSKSKRKSYLIVCDRPPYSSYAMFECLDMAMSAAAFDMPVEVLLRGDGVYAALQGQSPSELKQKDLSKRLSALEIYGVDAIYVCRESLDDRKLAPDGLVASVQLMDPAQVSAITARADLVVQL